MRANPGESTLILTSESDLERSAMGRWAERPAAVEDVADFGDYTKLTLSFRRPPDPGVNVDTAPAWTPKVGERVRAKGRPEETGTITAVERHGITGDYILAIRYDDQGGLAPVQHPGYFEPIPPPPRRTVRLPAIGQRVRIDDPCAEYNGRRGVVSGLACHDDGCAYSAVRLDGTRQTASFSPCRVKVLGDDPRWVEVTLPE